MKAYFSINHNPDSKDLKDLSEKTQLPKRVLQTLNIKPIKHYAALILFEIDKSNALKL
ncbi:Apterous-like protein [Dinothrombium tinctorium]|uniref:Apterous-like protein n=1 Tax=Dinothrombium tinctorium TaxID=1965070 RepID=A0A3S3PQ61_9ACAR|nr:Apterous-like protein [Dinothrombium tinctorium]